MYERDTLVIRVDPEKPGPELEEAARILREGGLVAFPTETVYGLGADATNASAIDKIYQAKGRPSDNPIIVHVSSAEDLDLLVTRVSQVHRRLMQRFWPGPLTLIFPRSHRVPSCVSGGLDTVAVRMPDHPVALGLIARAGVPIAAPSANLSGGPSPTTARHVLDDLGGRIDAVVDGGPTGLGVESTVLDLTGDTPVILRPGGVAREDLEEFLGHVEVDPRVFSDQPVEGDVPSPGMKYRHYAPRAELWLMEGPRDEQVRKIQTISRSLGALGTRIGILASDQTASLYDAFRVISMGDRDKPDEAAARLFAALRDLDSQGVDLILAEGMETEGLGLAVMNRLKKAATRIIHTSPKTVLFVCSGNTCRSPLAKVIFERLLSERGLTGYRVISAGVSALPGLSATESARQVAAEMGLDLSGHEALLMDEALIEESDLVLTMTWAHRDAVVMRFPEAIWKTFVLKPYAGLDGDVKDPFDQGLETYKEVKEEIREALERVLDRLQYELGERGEEA